MLKSNYSDVEIGENAFEFDFKYNKCTKRLNPDFEYVHKVSKGTQVEKRKISCFHILKSITFYEGFRI
jgi:hypothetical protein